VGCGVDSWGVGVLFGARVGCATAVTDDAGEVAFRKVGGTESFIVMVVDADPARSVEVNDAFGESDVVVGEGDGAAAAVGDQVEGGKIGVLIVGQGDLVAG